MSFVNCPKCGQQLNLSSVLAGSIIQCPCGARLRTPRKSSPAIQSPSQAPNRSAGVQSPLPPIESTGDIPTSSEFFVKLGDQVYGPLEKPLFDNMELKRLIHQNATSSFSEQLLIADEASGPFRLLKNEDLHFDLERKSKLTLVCTVLFTVINFVFYASNFGYNSWLVSLLFGICTSALIATSGFFFYYFPNFAKPIFPSLQNICSNTKN
ncbi:hypothetical protein N8639_00245 [bacterium]|nr:hypothetical protein [bacterium]